MGGGGGGVFVCGVNKRKGGKFATYFEGSDDVFYTSIMMTEEKLLLQKMIMKNTYNHKHNSQLC